MDIKNKTPLNSKAIVNKVLPKNCDSPFGSLPNISTPPSRFSKILNPFEHHLIDRLHLPTFSPSVFAQVSTPKTDKFKWTIDDISSLKPADIDEATISQHVSNQDPHVESIVQEKIEKFFNDKVIVPSPFSEPIKQTPLIKSTVKVHCNDNYTQTVLTLPPTLPKHVEKILAPYFSYSDNINEGHSDLYQKLFGFEDNEDQSSHTSSPAPSTGLSPIQFSPEFNANQKLESTLEMAELRDCTLSPIGRSPLSRSVCRLNFSGHMSVDASVVVPDVNKSLSRTYLDVSEAFRPLEDGISPPQDSINWDMEYKHVSILSRSPPTPPCAHDSITPQSKIFPSQRKRLSDSFKDEEKDVEMKDEEIVPKRLKNRLESNDVTDSGFQTQSVSDSSVYMFASTPTKVKF